jgi:endonuclease/exonuclease/phosphatase family metal-dependent hydrolase
MGILYNKSVLQLIESGTFWLSETPDVPSKGWGANHKRSATWSIFKHRTSGKKFCYVNTHIDHESKEAQVEGMKLISRFLQKYRKDYMLFVSADFNMSSTNDAFDVVESYLHNTREVAPEGLTDDNTTYNGYTPNKHSIIDHIYCSNYLDVVEYHTINEQYGSVKYISDHYPIYSIIKLQ